MAEFFGARIAETDLYKATTWVLPAQNMKHRKLGRS